MRRRWKPTVGSNPAPSPPPALIFIELFPTSGPHPSNHPSRTLRLNRTCSRLFRWSMVFQRPCGRAALRLIMSEGFAPAPSPRRSQVMYRLNRIPPLATPTRRARPCRDRLRILPAARSASPSSASNSFSHELDPFWAFLEPRPRGTRSRHRDNLRQLPAALIRRGERWVATTIPASHGIRFRNSWSRNDPRRPRPRRSRPRHRGSLRNGPGRRLSFCGARHDRLHRRSGTRASGRRTPGPFGQKRSSVQMSPP